MTIEELSKDSEFLKKIEYAKGPEEIVALFKDKGIDVSKEDLEKIAAIPESSELSESDMENVAGGFVDPVSAALAFGVGWVIGKAIRKAIKK